MNYFDTFSEAGDSTAVIIHTTQFLQVGWLYRALTLLGLALSSKRLCVFGLNGAI